MHYVEESTRMRTSTTLTRLRLLSITCKVTRHICQFSWSWPSSKIRLEYRLAIMESVLTLDDLPLVIQELSSAASKWHSIGFQLGLSELELKPIESTHPRQHLDCLRDVIFKWLSSGARHRASLIEALRSSSVGETSLADRLTKKYSSPFPPRTTTSKYSTFESETTPHNLIMSFVVVV